MKNLVSSLVNLWVRGRWIMLLMVLAGPARAQFPATASTTEFICNAPGDQLGVQAFADGAGGSFVAWIDKRGGRGTGPGTALYFQHVNVAGVPLLAANGVRLFQTRGREIWGMRAVAWRGGVLVAWVQGRFGVGGDTLRCQYYNAVGLAQWAVPTVVSAPSPNILGAATVGLNVLPTDSGATITHALGVYGGGTRFSFNRVSFAGVLRWPLNAQQVNVVPVGIYASDYYHTLGDGGNGFYLVASSGGLGAPIYAQHYTLQGASWGSYTVLSAGGNTGRGSDWQLLRDPANSLYVAWSSSNAHPLVSKVLPSGALAWPGDGTVNLCAFASQQLSPDALWHDNALWMIWTDNRPSPTGFGEQYLQKINAAGTLAFNPNGVLVNSLAAGYPSPRLAASNNGAVMAFFLTAYGAGFRAQKVLPTAALGFPASGVVLHDVVPDQPAGYDYVPVSQPNGSVQVYWASAGGAPTGQDICAGRMQNSGILLGTERAAGALGFEVFPNPAAEELQLRFPVAARPTSLRLYDGQGRLVRAFAEATARALSLRGLPAGLYVLRARLNGQEVSRRVAVE